jgi:hypothetical protein
MRKQIKHLDLIKECKGFKKTNKRLKQEIFIFLVEIKAILPSMTQFIVTKEKGFEPTRLEDIMYVIYDLDQEIEVKNLFFRVNKIMETLETNQHLLSDKVHYSTDELEKLEIILDHVEILITELQVPPHQRVGLFFKASDEEMISKFSNLVNQINSTFNQQ